MTAIPGYTYDEMLAPSPVSIEDLELLKASLLWTDDDNAALLKAGQVLEDQIEDILDVWYGYVGANAHLVKSFSGADGNPSGEYLAAVRLRFGQWIRDTCTRDFDEEWLAYQNEVAHRHLTKLAKTDGIETTETHIPLRYLISFIFPITATMRPFLAAKGASESEVDAMHAAWFKAVTLTVSLWSQPYNTSAW
ncbi:MAG: protogloblin ApPgb [Cryobacterium sp.]|nr:protogloblin ApPgb [Cryobacterium sp.]